jgi:hypothetical protein
MTIFGCVAAALDATVAFAGAAFVSSVVACFAFGIESLFVRTVVVATSVVGVLAAVSVCVCCAIAGAALTNAAATVAIRR